MAYTAPDASDFSTKFPELSALIDDDDKVDAAILEAGRSVDNTWLEGDYATAILYLAAHILTVGIAAIDSVGQEKIKSLSIGPLSITFGEAVNFEDFSSTPYGQAYLSLARKNHPPILVL